MRRLATSLSLETRRAKPCHGRSLRLCSGQACPAVRPLPCGRGSGGCRGSRSRRAGRCVVSVAAGLLGLAAALLAAAPGARAAHPEAAGTIVVATDTLPESLQVARHYMEVRGIPAQNLCVLHAPPTETVDRKTFQRTIWDPLYVFLQRWEGQASVQLPDGIVRFRVQSRRAKYLVPVYGVPVKVSGYEDVQTMHMSRAAAVTRNSPSCPGTNTNSSARWRTRFTGRRRRPGR